MEIYPGVGLLVPRTGDEKQKDEKGSRENVEDNPTRKKEWQQGKIQLYPRPPTQSPRKNCRESKTDSRSPSQSRYLQQYGRTRMDTHNARDTMTGEQPKPNPKYIPDKKGRTADPRATRSTSTQSKSTCTPDAQRGRRIGAEKKIEHCSRKSINHTGKIHGSNKANRIRRSERTFRKYRSK